MALTVVSAFLVLLLASAGAYAYIDPGSGSYIFQCLIAGLLAGLYLLKAFWKNIVAWVAGLFGPRGRDAADS